MDYSLNVGAPLPTFSYKNQNGASISSKELIGQTLVLFFYPKDDTPGCTKEACSFRDRIPELKAMNALVLGISPDNTQSHLYFSQKYSLNFPLIADPSKEICKAFDVIRTKVVDGKNVLQFERSTFVIDPQGIIRWIERPVQVEGHIEKVIDAVKKYAR